MSSQVRTNLQPVSAADEVPSNLLGRVSEAPASSVSTTEGVVGGDGPREPGCEVSGPEPLDPPGAL